MDVEVLDTPIEIQEDIKMEKKNNYGYNRSIKMSFEEAVRKTKKALKNEGFGVLTEIDVKETLKKKLNVDYDNYIILGACNPPFAYNALQTEKGIGLLLPCNVIVYSQDWKTFVSAINPVEAMSFIDNPELKNIALQIQEKLVKAIDSINIEREKN